jgi:sigma-E factor negative regulatory protein RseA
MRGGGHARLPQDFHARVNRAIDGEPLTVGTPDVQGARPRWQRPFAGAALAAGVAAIAVFALQQRAIAPTLGPPVVAQNVVSGVPKEALSYTVPAPVSEAPTAMPAARLTNYVFAHSKYSSALGHSNVLSELLTDADARDAGPATHDPSP